MQNNYIKQLISPIIHYYFTNSLQYKHSGRLGACEVIFTYVDILTAYLEPKSSQLEYKFHSKHSCEDDIEDVKELFVSWWLIMKFHC
jgi:hypothetical protein